VAGTTGLVSRLSATRLTSLGKVHTGHTLGSVRAIGVQKVSKLRPWPADHLTNLGGPPTAEAPRNSVPRAPTSRGIAARLLRVDIWPLNACGSTRAGALNIRPVTLTCFQQHTNESKAIMRHIVQWAPMLPCEVVCLHHDWGDSMS
jgi:hypothetical protein